MIGLKSRFAEYSSYHLTRGNQWTHYLGIPMIVITLLGLLTQVQFGVLDLGLVVMGLSLVWYFLMDWRLAIPFSFLVGSFYYLGKSLPLQVQVVGFVLGWILQFIGHYFFEKRSPAFYKNFEHLLVGPIWIFAKWVGYKNVD